jgi:hypothetical protein
MLSWNMLPATILGTKLFAKIFDTALQIVYDTVG